jgi:hypothetical protein
MWKLVFFKEPDLPLQMLAGIYQKFIIPLPTHILLFFFAIAKYVKPPQSKFL